MSTNSTQAPGLDPTSALFTGPSTPPVNQVRHPTLPPINVLINQIAYTAIVERFSIQPPQLPANPFDALQFNSVYAIDSFINNLKLHLIDIDQFSPVQLEFTIKAASEYLRRYPSDLEVRVIRILCNQILKNWDAVIHDCTDIPSLSPYRIFVLKAKAKAYIEKEAWNNVCAVCNALIQENPHYLEYVEIIKMRIKAYSEMKLWPLFVNECTIMHKFDPLETVWLKRRTVGLQMLGEWQALVNDCNAWQALTPSDFEPELFYRRCLGNLQLGNWDHLIEDCSALLVYDPKQVEIRQWRCQGYLHKKEWIHLIRDCQAIQELLPNDLSTLRIKIMGYINICEWDLAMNDCMRLVNLLPNDIDARMLRIITAINSQRWDQLINDCNDLLNSTQPENQQLLVYRLHGLKGKKDWDAVISECSRLLRKFPASIEFLKFRAEAYRMTGEGYLYQIDLAKIDHMQKC